MGGWKSFIVIVLASVVMGVLVGLLFGHTFVGELIPSDYHGVVKGALIGGVVGSIGVWLFTRRGKD